MIRTDTTTCSEIIPVNLHIFAGSCFDNHRAALHSIRSVFATYCTLLFRISIQDFFSVAIICINEKAQAQLRFFTFDSELHPTIADTTGSYDSILLENPTWAGAISDVGFSSIIDTLAQHSIPVFTVSTNSKDSVNNAMYADKNAFKSPLKLREINASIMVTSATDQSIVYFHKYFRYVFQNVINKPHGLIRQIFLSESNQHQKFRSFGKHTDSDTNNEYLSETQFDIDISAIDNTYGAFENDIQQKTFLVSR